MAVPLKSISEGVEATEERGREAQRAELSGISHVRAGSHWQQQESTVTIGLDSIREKNS